MNQILQDAILNERPAVQAATGIIEIIGPPGVGKSTIYQALCKKWNADANWIYPDALLSAGKKGFGSWLRFRLRKIIKAPAHTAPVNLGLEYIGQHKALADFLWNYISGSSVFNDDDTGMRFRAIYFLFRDFCNYQTLSKAEQNRPCIIDEGLLEKSYMLLANRRELRELVQQYLSLLPLPSAVVYVNTKSTAIIADRLLHRKKIIASHIGLNRAALEEDVAHWQYYFSVVIEQLNKRNVPVLFIDGADRIDVNARLISEFLKQGK